MAGPEIMSYNSTAALPCRKCGMGFKDDSAVTLFEERRFHVRCMTCNDKECKKKVTSDTARGVNGLPYCSGRCYLKASREFCAGCGEPLSFGQFLDVKRLHKKFHVGCFKCSRCNAELIHGYQLRNKEPVCPTCFRDRGNVKPIGHPPSALLKNKAGTGAIKSNAFVSSASNTSKPSNRPLSAGRSSSGSGGGGGSAGANVAQFCGECGTRNSGNRFCGECGNNLALQG